MINYIENRVREVADFILSSNATMRQTAEVFGVSKDTIHKDVTERLPKINPQIYDKVHAVVMQNKDERYSRGGKAKGVNFKNRKGSEEIC